MKYCSFGLIVLETIEYIRFNFFILFFNICIVDQNSIDEYVHIHILFLVDISNIFILVWYVYMSVYEQVYEHFTSVFTSKMFSYISTNKFTTMFSSMFTQMLTSMFTPMFAFYDKFTCNE